MSLHVQCIVHEKGPEFRYIFSFRLLLLLYFAIINSKLGRIDRTCAGSAAKAVNCVEEIVHRRVSNSLLSNGESVGKVRKYNTNTAMRTIAGLHVPKNDERTFAVVPKRSLRKSVSAHNIQSRVPRIGWECKTRRRAQRRKIKWILWENEVDDGEKEEDAKWRRRKNRQHTSMVCARPLDASVLGVAVVVN